GSARVTTESRGSPPTAGSSASFSCPKYAPIFALAARSAIVCSLQPVNRSIPFTSKPPAPKSHTPPGRHLDGRPRALQPVIPVLERSLRRPIAASQASGIDVRHWKRGRLLQKVIPLVATEAAWRAPAFRGGFPEDVALQHIRVFHCIHGIRRNPRRN